MATPPLLGAHTSIAGGVTCSIPRATSCGFTAAQIFVKNNHQWLAAVPLKKEEISEFLRLRKESGLVLFGHTGYLINPGSAKAENRKKSLTSLVQELERANQLQLPFLVLHPGSHGGEGEETGFKRILETLNEAIRRTPGIKTRIALENTAGSGTSLGGKLEHLERLHSSVEAPGRFGICIDTAHLFEAGYPIHEESGYESTMREIERRLGKKNVLAFHLNDSKTPLGSRVDRHEHIGKGKIGTTAFRLLMQDPRWIAIPKVLETPKGEEMKEDVENLKILRRFLKKSH